MGGGTDNDSSYASKYEFGMFYFTLNARTLLEYMIRFTAYYFNFIIKLTTRVNSIRGFSSHCCNHDCCHVCSSFPLIISAYKRTHTHTRVKMLVFLSVNTKILEEKSSRFNEIVRKMTSGATKFT